MGTPGVEGMPGVDGAAAVPDTVTGTLKLAAPASVLVELTKITKKAMNGILNQQNKGMRVHKTV